MSAIKKINPAATPDSLVKMTTPELRARRDLLEREILFGERHLDAKKPFNPMKAAAIGGGILILVFIVTLASQAFSGKEQEECFRQWIHCIDGEPDPSGNQIRGVFELVDRDASGDQTLQNVGGSCSAPDYYDDIHNGTQVTVKNEKGTVIANGDLVNGRVIKSNYILLQCAWDIEVTQVPRAAFYEISVGRRGELRYSIKEMYEIDWYVAFTLGD